MSRSEPSRYRRNLQPGRTDIVPRSEFFRRVSSIRRSRIAMNIDARLHKRVSLKPKKLRKVARALIAAEQV